MIFDFNKFTDLLEKKAKSENINVISLLCTHQNLSFQRRTDALVSAVAAGWLSQASLKEIFGL